MKTKTRKRVLLTMALAAVMLFAMSIVSAAGTTVTNLRQTGVSDSSVKIEWDETFGAYGYNVYVSANGVDGWVRDEMSTKDYDTRYQSYDFWRKSAGTRFFVKIVPVFRSDYPYVYTEGEASAPIAVITTPNKPTDVDQIDATTKSVTLTWKGSNGATYYNIYKDDVVVATSTTTSAVVKTSAGSNDNYRVCAVKKEGDFITESGTSSKQAKAAPNAPIEVANFDAGNLRWDPSSNTCKVGFKKSDKDSYSPSGFEMEIYTVDGKKKLKTFSADSSYSGYGSKEFTLKKVKAKGFQVRVRSFIKIGNKECYGTWSKKKVVIPQAHVSVKQTGSSTMKVSWKKVAGAKKYYVYAYKNGGYTASDRKSYKLIKTVGAKTTSVTVKGLKKGKYQHFYVIPAVKVGKKTYKGEACYDISLYTSSYY